MNTIFRKLILIPVLFLTLCPAVCWVTEQERRILSKGRSLSTEEIEVARLLGVKHLDRVRVETVPGVPMPSGFLDRVRRLIGFPAAPISLAAGHGIFLSDEVTENRFVLAHELVHVAQFERFGGIRGFLREYLSECLNLGYTNVSFETEANRIAIAALYGKTGG